MNTHTKLLAITLCIFAFIFTLFAPHHADATTGGPSNVYSFTYNPQDESVYFIEQSQDGRGCPPVLKKISLNASVIQTVYSCDQGEALRSKHNTYEYDVVMNEIQKITSGFKNLSQIDLSENNIAVDIDFSKNLYFENDTTYLLGKEFTANIFQNNKKILQQKVSGCTIDQPFTFAGYSIPGFNQKIIMLVSTIGDCVEGGYVKENIFVVGGVQNLNKDYTTNYYKNLSPLAVSKATLVVFESQEITETIDPVDEDINEDNPIESIPNTNPVSRTDAVVAALMMLAIGLLCGWLVTKNKK